MSFAYAFASDVGRVRDNNEDSARVVEELSLFVVADGMGGHVAGEIASRVAADTLAEAVASQAKPRHIRDESELMLRAMHAANQAVLREGELRDLQGMGTTLTAVRLRQRTATIAHIGDSRVYYVGPKKIERVTTDHTFVSMLLATGAIDAREADQHPERHLLTQAIGTQVTIEPQVLQKRLPRSGRILISSDGLHDFVLDPRIRELALAADLDESVRALIGAAHDAGAPDNVTVVLVDPNAPPAEPPSP